KRELVLGVAFMAELRMAHAHQLRRGVPERFAKGWIREQQSAVEILNRDSEGGLFHSMAKAAVALLPHLLPELSCKLSFESRHDNVPERFELVDESRRPRAFGGECDFQHTLFQDPGA